MSCHEVEVSCVNSDLWYQVDNSREAYRCIHCTKLMYETRNSTVNTYDINIIYCLTCCRYYKWL